MAYVFLPVEVLFETANAVVAAVGSVVTFCVAVVGAVVTNTAPTFEGRAPKAPVNAAAV